METPPAFCPGALPWFGWQRLTTSSSQPDEMRKERTGYGCFMVSPDWKARAKNTTRAVFLAGPPVTAALQPLVGWSLVSQLWPEPVKVGSGASVPAVLAAVDFGEVVLHPSGWMEGIGMPRG